MIPEQLIRNPEESNEAYCWRLMNDYKANPETLRFCHNYIDKEGERCFSKWISLMELWHYDPEELLPQTHNHMTRTEFFETIQHRTILPCELTFDIDDRTLGKGMIFPNIKAKARFIYNQLKNKHKLNPVVYWTGSKSYHLTTIIPELRYLPYNERREYRANLLSLYACDGLKASESCPIACEGTIHYKSGKRKEVVEL